MFQDFFQDAAVVRSLQVVSSSDKWVPLGIFDLTLWHPVAHCCHNGNRYKASCGRPG